MAQLPAENSTLARAVRRAADAGTAEPRRRALRRRRSAGRGAVHRCVRTSARRRASPVSDAATAARCWRASTPTSRWCATTEHRELTVDAVRALRQDVYIRPNEAARKVYIIADSHQLNERDQNVLLKIVEEGPPYAAFVFCTDSASALLETVRSRCVLLKYDAVSEERTCRRKQSSCAVPSPGERCCR